MLSDTVTLTMVLGFVAENDSHVERAIICSNKCFICIPERKVPFLVHSVSNVDSSTFDENDFVNVIEFVENNCIGDQMSIIHLSQNLYHEVSVSLIVPTVFIALTIENGEEFSESIQKVGEIEVCVDFVLNLFG